MTTLHVHFNDRASFTKAVQHVAYEWPPRHFAHEDLGLLGPDRLHGSFADEQRPSWGHVEQATREAIALYNGEVTS